MREILVGQSKIVVSGNATQPQIEMILKKDDANTPYFIMDSDGIRLHFDMAASDGNTAPGFINVASDGVTINANNITLGQADTLDTLTLNGNLTVKGTTIFENDVNVTNGEGGDDTFTIEASSGNTVVAGTSQLDGNVAVGANKFTIASSTGNTVVAGTLDITGVTTHGA